MQVATDCHVWYTVLTFREYKSTMHEDRACTRILDLVRRPPPRAHDVVSASAGVLVLVVELV
jgi:hypothetical protein